MTGRRGGGSVSKRLTKQEIREDRVMMAATQATDYVRANALYVGGAVAVVLVLAIAGTIFTQGRVRGEKSAGVAMSQAQSLFFNGDFAQASTQFQAVADRYGSARSARLARLYEGNAQLANGNAGAAEQAYRKFLNSGSKDQMLTAAGHRGLAGSLAAQEKHAEAAAEFVKAAQTPDDPLAASDWLQAGRAYSHAGQMPDAAHAYQQILDNYPSSAAANEARIRLQEATAH
jgi:TolA-binding protein